jgi:hypothetical protein
VQWPCHGANGCGAIASRPPGYHHSDLDPWYIHLVVRHDQIQISQFVESSGKTQPFPILTNEL